MLEPLFRKQSCEAFNRLILVQRLLSSDAALVQARPKLKLLIEANTTRIKTKFRGKFIENLFLDKFEPKIFEYPQFDTLLEYQILRKHYLYVQELLSNKLDNENSKVYEKESDKIIETLKNLDFTGFTLPLDDGGFGYLSSEYTVLQEALGVKPSLSKAISENEDFGINLISAFGNQAQKNEYLGKLTSGQSIACFAHLESQPLVTRGPVSLRTTAIKTPDGYIVSGRKNWVYNASYADIIIFSANVVSEDSEKEAKPVLFIVDKNIPGIKIHEPFNLMGMKGLDVCEVSFNNVVVPSVNVLGDAENAENASKLINKILSKGKLNNGAQCIAIMKIFLNKAIIHCIHNKFFDRNKYEKSYYKIKIGKIASRIYTVESMTYLLTGRLDEALDEADVFLESLITKIFASENLQYVLKHSLAILGSEGFLEEKLIELAKDCQFYMACDDTNDHLRLMLSSAGCEHVLKHGSAVNILKNLKDTLSRNCFKLQCFLFGDELLKKQNDLQGYLHLMFATESFMLETSVFLLYLATKRLIKKYGENVFDRHSELNFLADIVINIYAMTATLARASRAFCLGFKNDKVDKHIVFSEIERMYEEVRRLTDVLKYSKFSHASKVGSSILNCKNFSDQFPIVENLLIRNQSKAN